MSTYSTNLKIELIGNGEQSGTWGDTTNGNLGTVLEEAVVGKTIVTVSDNPASPTVLTMGNGPATSPARNLYLSLEGALTANRAVTVPAIKKTYIVKNATTGGFSITFGSGGSTITIPNGKTNLLYVDGSTVDQQFSDLLAGTTIGNVAIVDLTSAQTMTNKTLTSPLLNYPTLVAPLASVIRTAYYRTVTLSAASIATTNTSSSIVITDNANGAVVGDYVLLQSAVAVGGITAATLNQTFLITAVTTNTVTVDTGSAATSTTTGGGTPTLYYYHAATIPSATTTLIGTADTATLTNKRITPRIGTVASASTITPTSDASDQYNVTALAVPATFAVPSGTPTDGQKLIIRILDNGTARALTWTTTAGGYRVVGTVLPTTTIASKTTYVGCIYNSAAARWDVVAVSTQA